ncbi:hypothetical protein ABHM49_11120, partial [Xylella fastidiosa subsp. fastidiosa]
EHYIRSVARTLSNEHVEIIGEYKEFYLYNLTNFLYSAIDKTGLFNIEYQPGRPRNKQEWTHELQLIIDFVAAHTIPCQGEL